MKIAVQLEPSGGALPDVQYTWDADTEILSAQLRGQGADVPRGMSGSMGLEGKDGSWLIFDVSSGRIKGVEVAVWPEVQNRPAIAPPADITDAEVVVPARVSQPNVASLEMSTTVMAEADAARRVIHFRLGRARDSRAVRLGRDVLLEVDDRSVISGLWLLNVPPRPASAP